MNAIAEDATLLPACTFVEGRRRRFGAQGWAVLAVAALEWAALAVAAFASVAAALAVWLGWA